MELYLGLLIILIAYFVKGLSGFGPALIIVPFFTLLYDPSSALVLAAVFDFFAGAVLLLTVRKAIDWGFVFSIFIALALGTLLGSFLPGMIPALLLKKIIGGVILVFSLLILFQQNGRAVVLIRRRPWLKFTAGFLSGFLGGMVSMSGPPLVIYMKMTYAKTFFRTQLIGVFLLGTAWRSLLFLWHGLPLNIPIDRLILFFFVMLLALALGNRVHLHVREITFNKIIALILLIPAFSLLSA
jgi:uncharacterized membrane protein YfcA